MRLHLLKKGVSEYMGTLKKNHQNSFASAPSHLTSSLPGLCEVSRAGNKTEGGGMTWPCSHAWWVRLKPRTSTPHPDLLHKNPSPLHSSVSHFSHHFFSSTFWFSWQFCELHQGLPNTDKSKEPAYGHSFGTNKLCDPENVPSPPWTTLCFSVRCEEYTSYSDTKCTCVKNLTHYLMRKPWGITTKSKECQRTTDL